MRMEEDYRLNGWKKAACSLMGIVGSHGDTSCSQAVEGVKLSSMGNRLFRIQEKRDLNF